MKDSIRMFILCAGLLVYQIIAATIFYCVGRYDLTPMTHIIFMFGIVFIISIQLGIYMLGKTIQRLQSVILSHKKSGFKVSRSYKKKRSK